MSNEKLPFKTYRARRRPWDRFRKSRFDELRTGRGSRPEQANFPPPPPAPGPTTPYPGGSAGGPLDDRAAVPPRAGVPGGYPRQVRQPAPPLGPYAPSAPAERQPTPPRRAPRVPRRLPALKIVKYVLIWAVAWLLLSGILFVVSATIESGRISDETNAELGGGGNFITSPGTVLVLGLDKRPPGSKEPGASTASARSDSIMLLRAGGGAAQRLSILRDSYAQIPGHMPQKINAAYAYGGAALTVQTVEQFLGNGVDINHVIIIDFERFPRLIDALGGIDVTIKKRCVRSTFGGKTFKLRRGEHHLNGEQALRYARIRKNACDPSEDDRDRARRQQEVIQAMKGKAFSPLTFVRLPWVSWTAPKAIVTDMSPVTLMSFMGSMAFSSGSGTKVLKPSAPGPGGSLVVTEAERANAARRFLGG